MQLSRTGQGAETHGRCTKRNAQPVEVDSGAQCPWTFVVRNNRARRAKMGSAGFKQRRTILPMIRALCALCVLCAISWSTTADNAKPLTTILLVARAELPDPNFKDSIVLVMNHIGPSPAGVIIHRPTRLPVSRLFLDIEALAHLDDKVYFGGPVGIQSESVSFLFRADKPPEQATEV